MRDRPLILIVDDSEFALNAIRRAYRCKYDFVEAHNGKEAVEKSIEHQPDLILMDIMMVGMDGIDATKTIKNDPLTESIPIIITTAIANPQMELESFLAGADDYVLKPINCSILQARINKLLRLYDRRRN